MTDPKITISNTLDELHEMVLHIKIDHSDGLGVYFSADADEVYIDSDEIEEFGFSSVVLDGLRELVQKVNERHATPTLDNPQAPLDAENTSETEVWTSETEGKCTIA